MSNTHFSIQDSIARITIDRPKQLNALNGETLLEIQAHLQNLNQQLSASRDQSSARVLLIEGAGDKAFVAGADISELASADQEQLSKLIALGQSVMSQIEQLPIASIAAVDGFALGGGMELALACDLIAASSSAVFGLPEILLGVIPGFGGTQRLTARVGCGRSKRLVFFGEKINAEIAFQEKVCEYLFEHSEFEEKVQKLAVELSQRAPLALTAAKTAINSFSAEQLSSGLSLESSLFCKVADSQDGKNGLQAFLDKQKISFIGK